MFGQVWSWAGAYRNSERNIGVAPYDISTDLRNLFDDVAAWDSDGGLAIDQRAVRLHHRLTWIHPFPNGNGRCSRVFTDLYLLQRSAPEFSWGSGLLGAEHRTAYLHALRAADGYDYGPMMDFVRR